MNESNSAGSRAGCGCDVSLCEHRLASPGYLPRAEGVDIEVLQERADARELRVRGTSRRGLLGLFGSLGIAGAAGVTAPLAGCAGAGGPQQVARGRTHVLESNKQTVRIGAMDPKAPAAVVVDSGDVVHYTRTWVNWADEAKYGMSFEEREPIRKRYPAGPYSLVGPVEVRGAEPGDWIECRMVRLRPIEWGWNSAPLGVGALPTEFKKPYLHYFKFDDARTHAVFKDGVSYPLRPVQGVIATMPAGDKPVSAILSGPYGGNVLLRDLTEGACIFLPVQRPGGQVWTGDSHAAQGDGVVNQTAIESAMEEMRIQYVLHKRAPLKSLVCETPSEWIVVGQGPDLEAALTAGLVNTLDWLAPAAGLAREDVYSIVSVAGSVRVTQYAHQTNTVYTNVPAKGVHVVVPKAVFAPDKAASISRAMRTGA